MKNILRLIITLLAGVVLCAEDRTNAVPRSVVSDLPGSVIHSWLANSFATQKGHQSVPVTAIAMAVTPGGTVFSAGVAEGYGGVASYKDGKFVTKYDYDSGFGSSASAVAIDDTYVYIGTGVGLFRTRIGDEANNRTPITGGSIQGLALRDGELYLSDSKAGKIRVLATATMKELRSFAAPNPGPIAVGAGGRIWVVQGKPGAEPFDRGGLQINSFSKDGQPGPAITDFEGPCALTFDSKGHLLVGGLNRHCQIWSYDVSGIPKKVGTFGVEGGILSGKPGVYAPQRFHWIRGLGFDGAGNLYVAGVFGSWYNALIEAYSPTGQRLWEVYGLGNWLDTACTDPTNENTVYTKENVFHMDWSQPPGREQSLAGLTVNRFQYPLDSRVTDGHGPGHRLINGVRRIGGRLFLYCGGQGTGSLEIYKFGEDGCVAAPCGFVAGASPWRPGNGKRWPEDAETFIWTDGNGDGAPDAAEFAGVERKPRWGFMHLDAAAGIWQCSGNGAIFHIPCEGLDAGGNPIYRRASEVSYKYPPEFTGDRLRRLFYIPGEDVMIVGGSPGTEENACNVLVCYDHWSDPARRTKRWTINLPLNDKAYTPDIGYGGGMPVAMQACGKYLFVAYGYGLIRVHRLDNGGYVGTIRPDINGFKGSGGCVDSDNALNVTLRKNGEYVLFLENAGLNHVMMFRWTPPQNETSGVTPTTGRIVTDVPGRDWSLPASVRETPNAGWAWCTPEFARDWQKQFPIDTPPDTLHFCGYKYLIWADVNPAPGQYNWEAVDKWVAELTAVPHMGFAFYPAVYSRMVDVDRGVHTGKQYMAPHWLETEGWQGRTIRFYKDGEPTGWEPDSGYLGALEAFLKALAERYAKHPRFAYIDIRCIDHTYGEGQLQGASNKPKMDELEKDYGYSPERYETYMRALFDLYARLFPGQEAKCVIQTMGPYMAGPPGRYDAASERAWLYGFSKGFGGRDGLVESWMQYLNLGNGCSVDPVTRHLIAEEEWHPVLKAWDKHGQGPVWLTENEEWGADSDRGPKENEVTGWFVSNLRALQMRRNWIGLSSRTVWRDVPMSRYFQLSLGKTRATSPDAWCWLRESAAAGQWFQFPEEKALLGTDRLGPTNGWLAQHFGYPREYEYINSERGFGKVVNFERWLMQFDTAPDGLTQPALRTDTFQAPWDRKDRSPDKLWGQSHGGASHDAEHWARRTDHATGQNAIYFKVDPKWFQDSSGAVRLYLSYQDAGASTWRIEYASHLGTRQQSPPVTTGNTGELRTVTFELPSLSARGGFAGGNDFRLVRLAGGDVAVQLVRLTKWGTPQDSCESESVTFLKPEPREHVPLDATGGVTGVIPAPRK